MSTFRVADIPDMADKMVIVTGGSSGIKLATAHALVGVAHASCSQSVVSKKEDAHD